MLNEPIIPMDQSSPIKALHSEILRKLGTAVFAEWSYQNANPEDQVIPLKLLQDIYFRVGAILKHHGVDVGETEAHKRLADLQKSEMIYEKCWESTTEQHMNLWRCYEQGKDNTEIAEMLYRILHGRKSEVTLEPKEISNVGNDNVISSATVYTHV